jgi:SusD family.
MRIPVRLKNELTTMNTRHFIPFMLLLCSLFTSCEDMLEERPYSELDPSDVLTTVNGIEKVLVSAYGNMVWNNVKFRLTRFEGWPADLSWQTGGVENRTALTIMNWTWDASQDQFIGAYSRHYDAIRDANIILGNLDLVTGIADNKKASLTAEARFIRAWAYYRLYIYFGATPLRTSIDDPAEMPKASQEEMLQFIETELLAVIPDLPEPGAEAQYGRVTSGGARALLAKFYLNSKQWEKAAAACQDVIDMDKYQLFPSFEDLLKAENDGNSEMILVTPLSPDGPALNYMEGAFPPGFASWPEKNVVNTSWENHGTQHRLRESFYHSFDPKDKRREPILTSYVNDRGVTVDLLNGAEDNIRSFRFWPDVNAQGNRHGNDLPEIRYADILLARAEALNELNGPSEEAINLINQVRARADVHDLSVTDFATKEALRDHLVQERAWEFYEEGHRRTDLIRMGKFVEFARKRGVENAEEYRTLYPIPQSALDANPLLEQNPGY